MNDAWPGYAGSTPRVLPEHNGRQGLHRARAGIASAAAEAGLPMFDAAAALGHRDTRTTERTYTKAGARQNAAERAVTNWTDQVLSGIGWGWVQDDGSIRLLEPMQSLRPDSDPLSVVWPSLKSEWLPARERADTGLPTEEFRLVCLSDEPAVDGRAGWFVGQVYETRDGYLDRSGRLMPTEPPEWARPDLNWGLTPPKRQV